MIQTAATLIERRTFGPGQELRLQAPVLARSLTAGQAVLVQTGWGNMPYLRRIFYPIALDDESWTLRIPADGDWGHAWLRATTIGAMVDCLGPVGVGFSLPVGSRNVLCLGEDVPTSAAGHGVSAWALLPAIVQAVREGRAVAFAMEAVASRDLIPASRLPAAVEYHTATRSPRSAGQPASATAGVAQFLPELLPWADVVLAAGSPAFYHELAMAVRSIRYKLGRGFAQILYPAAFLCGVGACQACVADLAAGRRRICQRGPVLDLVDLVGEA